MNSAEKYIYEVYFEKGFSAAARKLYISQPALSNAIKNHEKHLGYKIFNRRTSPITLTREGSIYIKYLEERIDLEKELKNRLKSLDSNLEKRIAIGGSKSAAFNIIPKLCSEFHRQFPDVNITIDTGEFGPESDLFDRLKRDVLDFVICTNINPGEYNSLLLKREKYMIVMHKNYPGIEKLQKYSLSFNDVVGLAHPHEKEITDWTLFKDIKLFKPGQNTKSGRVFSEFFKITGDEPCRILHHHRMDIQYSLMREGMGAILMPQSSIIDKGDDSENLCYFDVNLPDNQRDIWLIYKEDSLRSRYVKDFIAVAGKLYPHKCSKF